jgi:hypothetical protein
VLKVVFCALMKFYSFECQSKTDTENCTLLKDFRSYSTHSIKYISKYRRLFFCKYSYSFSEGLISTPNQNLNLYTEHLCTQFSTKALQVHVSLSFYILTTITLDSSLVEIGREFVSSDGDGSKLRLPKHHEH